MAGFRRDGHILPQLRLFDNNLRHFCLVYATALYLIKPGVRLPCLFLLVAWVCVRLLVFRQQLFLGVVLALRSCVINYWLHSMILLFLFPPFMEENQLSLPCHLCYLGATLHQSTTCHTKIGPAGPILVEKFIPPDHFAAKIGPAGLILAAKIGPLLPKSVPPQK